MQLNNYKSNFIELFDRFNKGNFELSINHQHNLLKFLETSTDLCVTKILEGAFFCELILNSIEYADSFTTSTKVFIVDLIRIILRNELQFCRFVHKNLLDLLFRKLSSSNGDIVSSALLIASQKLALDCLIHSSGLTWNVQEKMYQFAFRPNIHHKPLACAKLGYDYVAKLVWQLNENDEEAALIEVLTYIVNPIKHNKYETTDELTDETDEALFDELVSHLRAFQAILSDTKRLVRKNKVVALLTNYFMIEANLKRLFAVARLPELLLAVADIIFRVAFASAARRALENNSGFNDLPREMVAIYHNLIMMILVRKRMLPLMIKFSGLCVKFWSEFDGKVVPTTFERHGRAFDLKDQFLITALLSLLISPNPQKKLHVDTYHHKLYKLASEPIVKASYYLRSMFNEDNATKYTIEGLREMEKLMNCLNDKQAGFIYQSLFYILFSHVKCDETDKMLTVGDSPMSCPDNIKTISLTIELVKTLLTVHNINWYESVEVVSLQNCLMNLLMQNVLPTKQLLQVLNLIDLSIKKLLSPDLALLVESRRGSTLNEIVTMIKTFVQHPEWEVRDSTLHLLLSCTDLAHIKYMPLQKLLLENDLFTLTVQAAIFDEEMYVQAIALRCLASATKIESIWGHITAAHPNLFMQIIHILRDNPNGIVRTEAANMLTEFYINQKSSPEFTNHLFTVMTSAATDDQHWEVQLAALNFWKATVQYETLNRGMIDGEFPSVTFCKVRRKIIFLKDKVIQTQLTGILNALANSGCLKVLIECLNEDSNIKVLEEANAVANDLMKILEMYKFESVPQESIARPAEVLMQTTDTNIDTLTFEVSSPESIREEIRNSIVNTNQSDLILEMYENYNAIKTEAMEEDFAIFTVNKWMDPNEFLKSFRSNDYFNMIENKRNWNSGPKNLGEVFNEIFSTIESQEIFKECE